MSLAVLSPSLLTAEEYSAYDDFLKASPKNLLYASTGYKKLIETHLQCESQYFVVKNEAGEIIGAFPLMYMQHEEYGLVVNSLPYYGSNGGIIVSEDLSEEEKDNVRQTLLKHVQDWLQQEGAVSATFITNPFEPTLKEWFEQNFEHDFTDQRIGQITPLPSPSEDTGAAIMDLIENPRPRNIRKAIKSEVTCYASNAKEDLDFLYAVHKDNIESIGGIAKSKSFFDQTYELMGEEDYKVYVAEKDGEKIAALLLFYYNKTVEYFTPATIHDFRNLQPSSLLIFEAMKEAIANGYQYWNWGGTWLSQGGVYDFKKKWGAEDYPYFYYTKVVDKSILTRSKEDLLKAFPNFFVLPFNQLASENEE